MSPLSIAFSKTSTQSSSEFIFCEIIEYVFFGNKIFLLKYANDEILPRSVNQATDIESALPTKSEKPKKAFEKTDTFAIIIKRFNKIN